MRVLFITSAYPGHPDDPRGIFIHRMAKGLVEQGVDISVLAPGVAGLARREVLDGVEVHRAVYWIPRWQGLAVGLGGIVPNLRNRPWLILQVPPLVSALTVRARQLAEAFDVIHCHWVYPAGIAGALARRPGTPLVVTSHGGDLNLSVKSTFLRRLSARVARKADLCIAVSQPLRAQFVSLGVPANRIEVIPCGVDLEDPSESNGSPELERFRATDGFRILYLGSLIRRKSVDTLLEAHRRLEDGGHLVSTAIVGAGPEEQTLRAMSRRLALRGVMFVAPQSPSQVPHWMGASHVLVLPSVSEGRPVVVLEAMARGLPIVATDIAGTRELVRDGETGLRFQVGDSASLADRLERLISNREVAWEMGRRGRAMVETDGLTIAHVARRHLQLYERILEEKRPR